jgi:hypothetical protein
MMKKEHTPPPSASRVTRTPVVGQLQGFVDGKHHINVWIRANTELGHMLSPQYTSLFTHPYFGPFNSMEGFGYYVRSIDKLQAQELRHLSGKDARTFGRGLQLATVDDFFRIIHVANYYKITQNPRIKELMLASTLPFEHYFFIGPERVLTRPQGYQLVIRDFTELREMIREGREPPELDYSGLPGMNSSDVPE